ncbi:NAD(P)H-dependent oxidoreductase [Labilibacter marinus]|uniref:NAD(P)H-dependent oxidoreductase n=1 Tax=Labilibacter marinus TaxID=1477105 RepID=UPI00094F797B|nr:NAD(P)H-dependent oxidoreductase [Labilibacter marinus]
MKNILIIQAHPDKDSFCSKLAQSYHIGATNSCNCKLIHLSDLNFNLVLEHGYKKRTELEPDLLMAQEEIKKADHLVFVYPTWWGTMPASLKGFIDRTFLPGFAFKYRDNSALWDKLLTGKSARLIVTMDAPTWYYNIFYKKPGHQAMKKATLNFCGVKPVRISTFGSVKSSTVKKREQWLFKVRKLGEALK